MPLAALLLLHAGATLSMTGLIWFVQIVHYPLFLRVGADAFRTYAAAHQRRTTWLVGPLMLLEIASATGLVLRLKQDPERLLAWTGLALLATIWLSTALIQVPLHRRLLAGFDRQTIERLIRSNWLRSVAWTLRSIIALWLLRPAGLA